MSGEGNKGHILYLHCSSQCPWHHWTREQAEKAAGELNYTFEVVDVSESPEQARRYRMFYPFMTIIDGKIRLPSPSPSARGSQACTGP